MAIVSIRIGNAENVYSYDDGEFDSAIESTAPIKAGAPVDPNDVLLLGTSGLSGVSGPATSTDNAVVRFDGAVGTPIQNSLVIISDAGGITIPNGLTIGSVGAATIIQLNTATVRIGDGGATNYVEINTTGDMSFVGTATIWNDLFFPMSSGRIGGANQPTWTAFQGNISEYTFSVNDYIHLPSSEISHGYKEESDFELHCHIVTNGSDVGDTEVNYEVEYTIGNINGVMSAAAILTSGDFIIVGGTTDRTHRRIELGTISGTGILSMSSIKIRFRRIARVGGGTDPTSDPFVTMVGVHIEEDTVGSRTEEAK